MIGLATLEFGRNIAELRKAKNMTQKELAEKAGISSHYLSRIEMGKRPGIKAAAMIANALGVEVKEFYVRKI